MTGRNRLKARLAAGQKVLAAWTELGSPEVAELMVHAGWDVIVIDCEHGAAGLEAGLGLIRAVEAAGGEAIIRVPDAQEATLKRALDRGARSLMVPMVHSAEMAADVAGFCRYPPRGRRGYAAPIVRASRYGRDTGYARDIAQDELLLMVQIEHHAAVAGIDRILAVPGIDMAFLGPNDLAGSLNRLEDLTHPEVTEAIARAEAGTRAAGRLLGSIEMPGRSCGALFAAGYDLVVAPNDISLLFGAARAARDRCEAELG